MRQENIETAIRQQKRAALTGALISAAIRLICAGVLLWCRQWLESGTLSGLLLAAAVIELGSLLPTGIVLRQRIKEIEGGEWYAAGQY